MPDNVTKVAAGATIIVPGRESVVVAPACSIKTGGGWYCVTHKEWFANQFNKDTHIHDGKHVLAWDCDAHGIERP